MATQFGAYEDEEDNVLAPKEPQVTSLEPSERKAARALRIRRRQEALKRAEQPAEDAGAEEEAGPIELATAAAAEELQRLDLDGAAKVTNVKVTTDEREVIRRDLFSDKMTYLLEKIEAEATDAQTQYEAITSHWDEMVALKDPLDIDAEMSDQRRKCDQLLAQKDDLIAELKGELKRMDTGYYEDLEKQDKDIKELSERIERQVTVMQRAYEQQLALIDRAVDCERRAALAHNQRRWLALYRQRDCDQLAHSHYTHQQLEEHKVEMEAIMWAHHEQFRAAKVELETLMQLLQQELEKLKAVCIINTEKIGYNYQILKKREEENVFVRSQQKRKLNKMSDVANKLRANIRAAADGGAQEEMRADAEITRLMRAMDQLQRKAGQFSRVNHYKFSQVWRMAGARCSELCGALRAGEVAVHAHVLAEPPPPAPHVPARCPLDKYEREMSSAPPTAVAAKEPEDPTNQLAKDAKDRLIRHILQLVADNTGFLMEERLFKLIGQYRPDSQSLCTLDAIFMALEIQAEEDIELLCDTFVKYAFCPACAAGTADTPPHTPPDTHTTHKNTKGERGSERGSVRGRSSVARSLSLSTSRSHVAFRNQELSAADQELIAEADEILMKCGGDPQAVHLATGASSSEGVSSGGGGGGGRGRRAVTVSSHTHIPPAAATPHCPYLCPVGHQLEIEPMQVLTALGEFVTAFVPPDKKKLYDIWESVKPPDFSTASRRLTTQEIEQYWAQWRAVFPADKDRFWDSLLSGINSYLPVLQERERLHSEVVHLRRRNASLRRVAGAALPPLPPHTAPARGHTRPGGHFVAPHADTAPPPLPPI